MDWIHICLQHKYILIKLLLIKVSLCLIFRLLLYNAQCILFYQPHKPNHFKNQQLFQISEVKDFLTIMTKLIFIPFEVDQPFSLIRFPLVCQLLSIDLNIFNSLFLIQYNNNKFLSPLIN
ncbi:transmembrane protein, putative (macronuclear) [Tetrahymena thermophila SB210]|uniref:Transmembrane protein, putative n=1 Tax=Tetrahymena thermophila (strain SB210) TaxID=312017 RepID=W7XFJ5_TETTS|nr:transmembrane protein, putative [Tetrahymena thermophila SB210]EWS71574.1 transmembrane protein, putative [Tetrahymena thermophila SB210]|eukprot:XP_012655887.1 transmembrane protein, putative [Tetrahymena thermophila SB210]